MEGMDMCQLVTQWWWVEARHALKAVLVVVGARLSGVGYDQKVIISFELRGLIETLVGSYIITIKSERIG